MSLVLLFSIDETKKGTTILKCKSEAQNLMLIRNICYKKVSLKSLVTACWNSPRINMTFDSCLEAFVWTKNGDGLEPSQLIKKLYLHPLGCLLVWFITPWTLIVPVFFHLNFLINVGFFTNIYKHWQLTYYIRFTIQIYQIK